MPKALLDFLGYIIYFWTNEEKPLEPIHVHVSKGKPIQNATKIWITKEGIKLENNNSNIPKNDLKKIMQYITANREAVIAEWMARFESGSFKKKF